MEAASRHTASLRSHIMTKPIPDIGFFYWVQHKADFWVGAMAFLKKIYGYVAFR